MISSFTLFPLLAAAGANADAEVKQMASGVVTFFTVLIAATVALQFFSIWITSKFLAEGNGSLGKAFMTLLGHTGIYVGGVVVTLMLARGSAGVEGVVGLLTFILNLWVVAKVYDFGALRAFGFMVLSSIISIALLYAVVMTVDGKAVITRVTGHAFGVKTEDLEKEEKERLAEKPEFASQKEAQAAAVKKYPALGVAGSPFNTAFVAKHAKQKSEGAPLLNTAGWPMVLADEVAKELGVAPQ